MKEFFRGWRRKVGCVALVMACALMMGWMRSWYYVDVLTINSGRRSSDQFQSVSGYLVWWSHRTVVGDFSDHETLQAIWGRANTGTTFGDPTEMTNMDWQIRSSGFGVCQLARKSNPDGLCKIHFISYVYVTVPLTLLSAYLILIPFRRRPSTEVESVA